MSNNTKSRIIKAAKPLFNKEGYGAPSLYQLSLALGMSRGNLTYYFNNKESLLQSIVEELAVKYEKLMAQTTQYPSWESTNSSTLAFHDLQQEYAFIFFDKQLLEVPEVKKQIAIRERNISWQLSIIKFSIQIGNMKEEAIKGTYYNLCRTIWSMSFFWLMSDVYKKEAKESDWSRYVWSTILIHFTDKGIESFKKHFGEDFFLDLGTAFEDFTPNNFGL